MVVWWFTIWYIETHIDISFLLNIHIYIHNTLPRPYLSLVICSNSCPLSQWYHSTILSFVTLFSLALNLSQHQSIFKWVSSFHQVAKVLALQLQHQFFQWILRVNFLYNWLVSFLCSPRDSQEASPTPQFKWINYSALSLLYGTALTSVHDYWKNRSSG